MAPGTIVDLLPHEKEQYRQGYKDGYAAGKAALRRELKKLLDTLTLLPMKSDTTPHEHTPEGAESAYYLAAYAMAYGNGDEKSMAQIEQAHTAHIAHQRQQAVAEFAREVLGTLYHDAISYNTVRSLAEQRGIQL